MLKFTAFALVALLPVSAGAYMDDIPDWNAVEVQTVIDRDPVVVSATVSKDRLSSLIVTMRGKRVPVAAAEFSDLIRPRLNTLRVISPDVKSSSGPAVIVELRVESDNTLLGAPLATARFHFGQFKYIGRDVSHQQLVYETKEPGQPPRREADRKPLERKP